jgi:hypothetical protein
MLQIKLSRIFSGSLLMLALFSAALPARAFNRKTPQSADLVKIPDVKFLAYLKEKIPGAFVGDEMNINSDEVATLTRINVINKKVINFEGIQYFTALEEFNCTYNLAPTLDLSKNTKLRYLVCWENRLTALDLSKNTELVVLNCGDNKITSLNISKNTKLRELYCEYNQLPALNLSPNKELSVLYCPNNKITALDLSKNASLVKLECANNPLTTVAKNNLLVEIPDQNFRNWLKEKMPNAFAGDYLNSKHNDVIYMKNIDVAGKGISSLQGIEYFTGLENLDCSGNKLSSLDLSKNTALTDVKFDGNPLTSLDLRGLRAMNTLTDLSDNTTITTLKVHVKLRDDARISAMRQRRGKSLTIAVYGAAAGSTDYILINSNDIPVKLDNRYRNNS